MMTYKQIEAAHETRMWIKDVIIPAVMMGVVVATNKDMRAAGKDLIGDFRMGLTETKWKIHNLINHN